MDYMKHKHDLSFGLACPLCGEKRFTKKEKITDGKDIIQIQECDSCFEISWYHLEKTIPKKEDTYTKTKNKLHEEYVELREFFGYKNPIIEKENKMKRFVGRIIHAELSSEDAEYFLSLMTELTMRLDLEKRHEVSPLNDLEESFKDIPACLEFITKNVEEMDDIFKRQDLAIKKQKKIIKVQNMLIKKLRKGCKKNGS